MQAATDIAQYCVDDEPYYLPVRDELAQFEAAVRG